MKGKKVSIHAPARGATADRKGKDAAREVSIHAPARGATAKMVLKWIKGKFQSTRPRGARQ